MAENYKVKQGDCVSSIAFEKGFFPDTIWNHPNNKDLKEQRKDPNILMPGDMVFVPDKRLKEVNEPTNQVHKFRMNGVPAGIILILRYDGDPIRNETYVLDIDGVKSNGKTDSDGKVRTSIPPNAKKGKLIVGEGERKIEYSLDLGQMDPIDEVMGFKKRLHDLGFDVGKLDAGLSAEFEVAIRDFETLHDIEQTGKMTEDNKKKLKEVFGC